MRGKGKLGQVGVEGIGAYGAGLARYLQDQGVDVLEVPHPDRRLHRQRGKSDPIDAEVAARTVLAGQSKRLTETGRRPDRSHPHDACRPHRRCQGPHRRPQYPALDGHHCPKPLRTQLHGLSAAQLVAACARLRPDLSNLADPTQAAKYALRSIAVRVQHLDTETRSL
jgi:hypothetical protein